jgi:hypothetical protein
MNDVQTYTVGSSAAVDLPDDNSMTFHLDSSEQLKVGITIAPAASRMRKTFSK